MNASSASTSSGARYARCTVIASPVGSAAAEARARGRSAVASPDRGAVLRNRVGFIR